MAAHFECGLNVILHLLSEIFPFSQFRGIRGLRYLDQNGTYLESGCRSAVNGEEPVWFKSRSAKRLYYMKLKDTAFQKVSGTLNPVHMLH